MKTEYHHHPEIDDYKSLDVLDEEEYRRYLEQISRKSGTKVYTYWDEFITKGKLPSYEWVVNCVFREAEFRNARRGHRNLFARFVALFKIGGRNTFSYYDRLVAPCKVLDIFQFFSEEFIEHVAQSIKKLEAHRIIEIGAGDGFLSAFLKDKGIDVVAIDDYSRPFIERREHVEKLDHKEALNKYNPDLVVINWEEFLKTYSIDVLEYPSVKYLLWIGEGPDGCTGSEELWEFDCDDTYNPYCLARTDDVMFNGEINKHTGVFIFYPTKTHKDDSSETPIFEPRVRILSASDIFQSLK